MNQNHNDNTRLYFLLSSENGNQLRNLLTIALDRLMNITPVAIDTIKDREELALRFARSMDSLREDIVDFLSTINKLDVTAEEIRNKSWKVLTSCVPVQEAFCDAKYHGYVDDENGHLTTDGIHQLMYIVHDDAHHFLRNGAIPVFRIWKYNNEIVFETGDRDEFVNKCEELKVENYQVALDAYDKNDYVGILNNPTIILPQAA